MKPPKPTEPTMADVAQAAGVGVATVDRVINRRAPVRAETARRVLEAAQALGFRRTGLIQRRLGEPTRPPVLGVLLQTERSPFYRELAEALRAAVRVLPEPPPELLIVHLGDLTPRSVAHHLAALGQRCDAVALVAAEHPQITQAVEAVSADGVPVFALVSDLSSPALAAYVGVDNRKMGRMAAWTMAHLSRGPGKVGLILGSHRYLCQEQCEIGFRSYLREHAPNFHLLETLVSLEDVQVAQTAVLELLHQHPDLVGIYIAGGGIEGVLEGLTAGLPPRLVTVCHDLTDVTRQALLDGHVSMVLSHPREGMARRLIELMGAAVRGPHPPQGRALPPLPFDIHTVANV
ncbi:LacI family transcriptional regulator [Sphaerotilus hippei]|uniref:LacI family transcriptional regulator n=1 Tax=Sphaerotilus hippei TaxID=744406 RepID=A0A318GVK0_9BURK|nr:LacI family DNA-binding transcriptional regulator [Sphaerotilus hippei]PXW93542.1 LacI family transcriptional regulator [Sphaerotilus hippei]